MQTQNVIRTIFSFTSEGLEGWLKQMTDARAEEVALKKTGDELNKTITDTSKLLDAQIKRWQLLDSTMNSGTPKKVRQEYAQLTKDIEANTAAKAKAVTQQEANTKALDAETKKAQEAAEMAKTYRKVVDELSKGLDNAEVSINSLAKAKKALNTELKDTEVGTEKYLELSKSLAQVDSATKQLTDSQRAQTKQFGVNENSIEALRLKVAALNKEWREMDQNNPNFQAVRDELAATTEELKAAEEEVGIFSRSVGNYEKAAEGLVGMGNPLMNQLIGITKAAPGAAGGIKSIVSSLQAFGKQLLALLANPVVAIMAAIVAVFMLFKKAINSSEEATAKFNKILAPLRVIFDAVLNVIQKVVGIVLDAVGAFMDLAMSVSRLLEKLPFVGKYFKEANDAIEEGIQLEKEKYELEKRIRDNQVEVAKNERDIANLKAKSAEKDKYTAEERLKFLREAAELERQNVDATLAIAKEKLRIAEAEAARAENTKETEEELANLRAAVYQAETQHATKMRKLNAQQVEAINQIKAERKAAADAAKSAADKAKQAQEKANQDYIKAVQDRQKATEAVRKAEIAGNEEELAIQRKILADREAALEKASKKRLTLSQLEKDELELQEYQHEKNLEAIREEAEEKKTNDYLSAMDAVRTARASLLAAEKSGNTEQVALYKKMLDMRLTTLAKYNADEIKLSEEQRLQQSLADAEFKQARIDEYIALQTELSTLEQQYQQAQTEKERQVIQAQINAVKEKTKYQLAALQALGVNASEIVVNANTTATDTEQYLTDRLQQSLETIQTYAGKHQNTWFKLASSISSLVAKAFDISKIRKKYGDDAKGIEDANKEIKSSMIDLGAAVAMTGLEAVTGLINDSIEQEKQALEEFYTWQEKRAQEAYDQQARNLQQKLDNDAISEAKYKLEQMKLDDQKAEEDKKREEEKANKLYDLELKQFRVEQAQAAISAAIATAVAIMQAWATNTVAAPALTAVISALSAVQIAAIYAQKPPQKPKFEKGGYLDFVGVDGPSHADGGVPVKIGDREVAEVEGGEGALIISKKAMRNKYMRRLLARVEAMNSHISGEQQEAGVFAEGGYLNYDEDFFLPARNSLKISKRKKRSIRINGQKVKLKPYGFNADAAIDAAAEEIAIPKWNAYIDSERSKLEARETAITDAINAGIGSNETLRNMDITDIDTFNKVQADKQAELDSVQKQIKVYEEAANARIDALKAEMQYEQKLADLEKQRQTAASDLAKTTEEFNVRVLGELRDTAQITEEEYQSMLDQVKHGYGVTYSDIINLKKKEVEAIKKLINEERNAELDAAKELTKYREDALAQLRTEWEENYNAITAQIIENVEEASEAVSQLTGTDLERFNEILRISREIAKMEEDYAKNETLLSDGVVQSREERARLLAEQKRIKEELELRQKEAEEAKAAFEEERSKNLESARKAYETENFASLLEQIRQLGSELQAEGSKWTLDKELAAELDENLKAINATYDEKIALQDAVIDGLQAEMDKAQLLHDQKMAYLKEEEDAFTQSFEAQKAEIESWLADTTSGLRTQASELSQFIAAIKVAGIEAGLEEYEKAVEALSKDVDSLSATGGKKYETGGAIELGNGLFQVSGPSHARGGVPVSVGGTKIAEVEGIEKMFAVNKLAAYDPEMIAALQRASDVNARYTGVPLVDRQAADAFMLDYERQAALIGQQINQRPIHTYLTHRDIDEATRIQAARRRSSWME